MLPGKRMLLTHGIRCGRMVEASCMEASADCSGRISIVSREHDGFFAERQIEAVQLKNLKNRPIDADSG
jgi:hypothetical protein